MAPVWNTHSHVDHETALAHIQELSTLTPPVGFQTAYIPSTVSPGSVTDPNRDLDLDTPDELAVRSLILGIVHRTLGDHQGSRMLLHDAMKHWKGAETNSWVGGVTYFELAVLDMKEGERAAAEAGEDVNGVVGEDSEKSTVFDTWRRAIRSAREALHTAHALCTREADLSSRLDSRIVMLREEIEVKMRMEGVSVGDM